MGFYGLPGGMNPTAKWELQPWCFLIQMGFGWIWGLSLPFGWKTMKNLSSTNLINLWWQWPQVYFKSLMIRMACCEWPQTDWGQTARKFASQLVDVDILDICIFLPCQVARHHIFEGFLLFIPGRDRHMIAELRGPRSSLSEGDRYRALPRQTLNVQRAYRESSLSWYPRIENRMPEP